MKRLLRRARRPTPLGEPDYQNRTVVDRIVRDEGVDRAVAELWFDEMLRFLDMCAESETTLSPSEAVDAAWHAFILNTRDYAAYCQEPFGRFLHHDPTGTPDPDAYARAYATAARQRGQLDPLVWPIPLAVGGTGAPDDDDDASSRDDRPRCSSGGGGGGGGCGGSWDGAHETQGPEGVPGAGASCGASCGGGGCGGGA